MDPGECHPFYEPYESQIKEWLDRPLKKRQPYMVIPILKRPFYLLEPEDTTPLSESTFYTIQLIPSRWVRYEENVVYHMWVATDSLNRYVASDKVTMAVDPAYKPKPKQKEVSDLTFEDLMNGWFSDPDSGLI